MTIKQILKLVFGGIFAFILTLLGIQRKTIVKQKEEIKEKETEIKTEKKKVEVKDLEVTTIKEVTENEKKLDEKSDAIKEEIIESKDDSEAIDSINVMLDKFNRGL